MAKKGIRQKIKKIPGYGSGNFNKMLASTILYASILIILLMLIVNGIPQSINLDKDELIPLAFEWLIVAILALLALSIHFRKKWQKK